MSVTTNVHIGRRDKVDGFALLVSDGSQVGVIELGSECSVFVDVKECEKIIMACENIIKELGAGNE